MLCTLFAPGVESGHLHTSVSARVWVGKGLKSGAVPSLILSPLCDPLQRVLSVAGTARLWADNKTVMHISFSLSILQSGMIRTQEADYFLKPLPSHLAGAPKDSAGAGPPSHILYKRSTEPRDPGSHQVAMMERNWRLENRHLFHHEDQPPRGGSSLRQPQKLHFCGRRKKCM